MSKTVLSFLLTILASCNRPGNTGDVHANVNNDTIISSTINPPKEESGEMPAKQQGQISDSILHAGTDTFSIQLQMMGSKDRKIIPLCIVSGKELFAVIDKEDKKANIRINQIQMPDSTFDGPFGDSFHYKIKMRGVYKIFIGPDLMAKGKLSGAFIFKAWAQ